MALQKDGPFLFRIVPMNNEQNGSVTHFAHYSARHHWHNAKHQRVIFFKNVYACVILLSFGVNWA